MGLVKWLMPTQKSNHLNHHLKKYWSNPFLSDYKILYKKHKTFIFNYLTIILVLNYHLKIGIMISFLSDFFNLYL
jgi:hypothetical protein